MRNFVFAVPVSPRLNDVQWNKVNSLLTHTVESVLNQTAKDFSLFIAGHEKPECLDGFSDPRIVFVRVDFPKPGDDRSRRRDKNRKRWAIGARCREKGGGYFMFLDADDFVHRDLVAHVLSDDNGIGYLITDGYALDYQTGNIATIPGAWNKNYNEVCGSSGIFCMNPEDLPAGPYPDHQPAGEAYFSIRNHTVFRSILWHGGNLQPIPFPAGIYSLNHTVNLSDLLVRTEERQASLIHAIDSRKIDDISAIAEQFGIEGMLQTRGKIMDLEDEFGVAPAGPDRDDKQERLPSGGDLELPVRMTDGERECLRKYLSAATYALEFGCGGSTRLALESGVTKLWSVESDKGWVRKIRQNQEVGAAIEDGRLELVHANLGKVGSWGRPVDESKAHKWHVYHSAIWKTLDSKTIDFVFVDGRFRVACTLQALLRVSDTCLIAVHDFWRRDRYFEILKYVDVVERIGELGVFRRKPDASPEAILDSLFDSLNDRA